MNRNMTQEEIDRIFIERGNKNLIIHEDIGKITYEVLSDFRNEIALDHLLWNCCITNKYELAKKLIEWGANINVRDLVGNSPLIIAKLYSNKEMIDLLIENGAHE